MKEGGRIARGEKISRSTGRRRGGRGGKGAKGRGGDEKSEKFSTRFLGSRAEVGLKRSGLREKRNEKEEEGEGRGKG